MAQVCVDIEQGEPPTAPTRRRSLGVVGTDGDCTTLQHFHRRDPSSLRPAGVKVAKHGGRGSRPCAGSADVLEALGVNLT